MIKNKNNEIIETLFNATSTGNLLWLELSEYQKKRDYFRLMKAEGQDGTEYELEIKYSILNDKIQLESYPSLWIRNKNLPNGVYLVNAYNSDNLIKLRSLIKDKFCSDMNPSETLFEKTLDEICKGISVSEYRENKIESLLNEGDNK